MTDLCLDELHDIVKVLFGYLSLLLMHLIQITISVDSDNWTQVSTLDISIVNQSQSRPLKVDTPRSVLFVHLIILQHSH